MIPKWLQSVAPSVSGRSEPVQQGAEHERPAGKKNVFIDVAHEVLRKDRANLDGLVRIGLPNVKRERLKGRVKKRVWGAVNDGFGVTDDGMVEEITERMVEAVESDPFYRQMFAEDKPDES